MLLSIDIGNGFVKTRSGLRNPKTLSFPSFVAVEQGAIRFDTSFNQQDDLDNIIIEFEDRRFAIGKAAYKSGRMQSLHMGRDRVGAETYRRLFATALATTIRRSDQLTVIASLPVEIYNGQRLEARQALSGAWQVGYAGQTYTYYIDPDNCHIVPEGFGALCSLLLHQNGKLNRSELETARVGVVDIGTRTTDYLYFDSCQLYPAYSDGDDKVGLSVIWQMLKEQISLNHGMTLNPHELDQALQNAFFKSANQEIEIGQEIENAALALATNVQDKIGSLWQGGRDVEYIILTGGGAPFICDLLPYDHRFIVENPYTANVEGAYRFGVRANLANESEPV